MMLVLFLTTLMLISVMVAAPYIKTERQREKEEDMIWRGKQYVRGIKLYYRKTGRFPTSMDDLTKPKLGSIRFMRQAYKDPMNAEDGSWRMIYVGPSGQLIGSLKPQQTFQIPGMPGAPGAATSQQNTSFGASGFGQSAPAQTGSQPGQPSTTQSATTASNGTATDAAAPSGLFSTDSSLMGGNIIGVGSKINKRSVIVYDKAKNYRLFEFVWNPSKDMANALNQQIGARPQNPQGTVQGTGSGFGGSGFGQPSNTPAANPSANPPTEMGEPSPPPTPPQPPPQ